MTLAVTGGTESRGLEEMGQPELYPTAAPARANGPGLALPKGMGSHATVALGISGENLACEELARQGYAVLATRYRTRVGELDIVARDGDTLVFVEVKTRTSQDFGAPAEAVTRRKQRRIVTMARWYLTEKGLHGRLCRFDVVTVLSRPGRPPVIEVVKNAFLAS
jgi:putative endonuclease